MALLLCVVPTLAVAFISVQGLALSAADIQAAVIDDGMLPPEMVGATVAWIIANALVLFVDSPLAGAGMMWVAFQGLQGRRASLGSGIVRAFSLSLTCTGLSIVFTSSLLLASLLLFVPGLMLWTRWSVAMPVLVIERTGILASLSRSSDLTRGRRWPVLGFLVLTTTLDGALFFALTVAAKQVGGAVAEDAGNTVSVILGTVTTAVCGILGAASSTALYASLVQAGESEV